MKLISIMLLAAVWSAEGHANLINLSEGKSVKEGVNISASAVVSLNNEFYALTTVGSGVRKKKMVVVPVKVYVAQVMVGAPAMFSKDPARVLESFEQQTSAAMHLTFLRDVAMETMRESFLSGLEANGIDTSSPDVVAFIRGVEQVGLARAGGAITVFVTKNSDGTETVAIENKTGQAVMTSFNVRGGLMTKIMAIWLGTPSDGYMDELKNEILN